MNNQNHRTVMLHADDFGMSPAVNAGIVSSFRDGLLTSTSLMANAPAAETALAAWRILQADRSEHRLPSTTRRQSLGDDSRNFDLGLHLNLTQGRPLTDGFPQDLRSTAGDFLSIGNLYRRLWNSGRRYHAALHAEITAQIRWMLDRGVTPTHVNGHQYVELIPAVTEALIEVLSAHQLRVVRFPCESVLLSTTLLQGRPADYALALIKRWHAFPYAQRMSRLGFTGAPHYFGTAHAGRVTLPLIERWVRSIPVGAALEVGLHPAAESTESPPHGWDDPLAALRPLELQMLTSPELAEHLHAAGCRLGRLHRSDAL